MFSWYRKPARIVGGLEMDQEEIGSWEASEGVGVIRRGAGRLDVMSQCKTEQHISRSPSTVPLTPVLSPPFPLSSRRQGRHLPPSSCVQ